MIELVAAQYGLPVLLLTALCTVESNLHNVVNVDDGGRASMGYCQIQARTGREHGMRHPSELLNPGRNADIAARILRSHYNRFHDWDKAVMAYNAGPYKPLRNVKYLRKVKYQWNRLKCLSLAQQDPTAGYLTTP